MFGRRLRYRGARGRLGPGGGGAFGFDSMIRVIHVGLGRATAKPKGRALAPTVVHPLWPDVLARALSFEYKETRPPLVARTSTLSRREGKIALVILSTPVSVLLCMQCFQIPERPQKSFAKVQNGFLQRF